MEKTDFSTPRRMSGSAYVIFLTKALKYFSGFILPYMIFAFTGREDRYSILEAIGKVLILLAVIIAASAITAFFRYRFHKYYIENGNLIIMYGFLRRETTSIPLSKIHSLRTKRGFMYRILDMRGISFDTLASKKEEVELILDEEDWMLLMAQVEKQEMPAGNMEKEDEQGNPEICGTADKTDAERQAERLKFSNFNLIKGALCQNHLKGMAVLFGIIAAFYDSISSISSDAVGYAIDYLDTHTEDIVSIQLNAAFKMAIVLYFFVMILWVGKVFLKYSNMDVRIDRNQLFFESGLISRNSSRFSYDKVCTLYIKRNIIEKILGCCTLQLKQAMNASEDKGITEVKIYGSGYGSAIRFLNWWLGKDYAASDEIMSAHSGKGIIFHTMRIDLILSLAATLILFFTDLYAWIAIPALYLLISLAKGICAAHRSRITLREDYVSINTGRFADIENYFKYSNIEVVRLRKTPFTPLFGRVMITISTNGTSFTVRSIRMDEAKDICELLLYKCENSKKTTENPDIISNDPEAIMASAISEIDNAAIRFK